MTVDDLLDALRRRRVRLAADGDRLHVEAPSGALTPDLKAALTAHKAELLNTLRAHMPLRIEADDLLSRPKRECAACWQSRWYVDGLGVRKCGVCHPPPSRN